MSTCKFCDAEIDWQERVPYNLDGSRHSCGKKPKSAEPRDCKFECKTLLLWDDPKAAFREVNTGELHTKERCQEAKAKLEQKNDHGNELVQDTTTTKAESPKQMYERYVDHTTKPRLKIKTFTDPTPEGLDLKVNTFGETHNVKAGQYQMAGALYSTQVWYEEIPLKQ